MVRDSRDPRGRDEGPSGALGSGSAVGALGGVEPRDFRTNSPMGQGLCPICGIKMTKGNQRACVKMPKGSNSWQAMRKRGRGGYVYGRGKAA